MGKFDFSYLVFQVRDTFLDRCVKLSHRVLLKLVMPVFNSKNRNTNLYLGVCTWKCRRVTLTWSTRQ